MSHSIEQIVVFASGAAVGAVVAASYYGIRLATLIRRLDASFSARVAAERSYGLADAPNRAASMFGAAAWQQSRAPKSDPDAGPPKPCDPPVTV